MKNKRFLSIIFSLLLVFSLGTMVFAKTSNPSELEDCSEFHTHSADEGMCTSSYHLYWSDWRITSVVRTDWGDDDGCYLLEVTAERICFNCGEVEEGYDLTIVGHSTYTSNGVIRCSECGWSKSIIIWL